MTDVLWFFFEIAVNAFQAYITIDFVRRILRSNKKHKNIVFIIFMLGNFTLLTIQSFISVSGTGNIPIKDNWFIPACLLLVMIYTFYTFEGPQIKKMIAAILPVVLLTTIPITVQDFSAALFNKTAREIMTSQTWERVFAVIVTQAALFITLYSISLLLSKSEDSFSFSDWAVVAIIMLVAIVMEALLRNSLTTAMEERKELFISLSLLLLIVLIVLMFNMMISLIKKNKKIRESEELKARQQYQQYYIDNATEQYETIRKIRHDIKNQLSAIGYLIQNKKLDDANDIIRKFQENVDLQSPVVSTDNMMVNAIVNSKLTAASAMGITVSCFCVKSFEGIDDHDLCSLLSNLIENAYTACMEDKSSKTKMLSVKITAEDGAYTFLIANSIDRSVLTENPKLLTTKKDKSSHGLGTKIIREIADKYNGRCDYFEENGIFYCKVVLIT